MQVPSFLYGRFQEVKKACRRKVTMLKRGAAWHELAGDLIDTRDHPGLFVLDGPSPLVGTRRTREGLCPTTQSRSCAAFCGMLRSLEVHFET